MLNNAIVFTTIPVKNLDIAKDFYVDKLGLTQVEDPSNHGYMLEAGQKTKLFIFQTDSWIKGDHVIAAFFVGNIETTVDELIKRGVIFEKKVPGIRAEINAKGIAGNEHEKGAWFKDPDGNLLSLSQLL